MTGPRIGSLCTGYGGLDMAVRAVLGGQTVWHADNDPGAAALLAHHWPDVPNLGDITAVHWPDVAPVDVLTAGYPCQPFSMSGQRKRTDDIRHLWPHIARAIRHLRPRIVVLENVAGHRSLGFGAVLGDLAGLRYVGSWVSLRASDVGAVHARERVFILAAVADSGGVGWGEGPGLREVAAAGLGGRRPDDCDREAVPVGAGVEWGAYWPTILRWREVIGRPDPDPRAAEWRLNPVFVEWMMGLGPGFVTGVPGLSDRDQLRILGNGVVPQQGEAALRLLLDRLA